MSTDDPHGEPRADQPQPPPPPPAWGGTPPPPPYTPPPYTPLPSPPQYEPPPAYPSSPYGGQLPPPPAYGGPQYGQPAPGYGYQGYAPPQNEGTAIGALVAAIISWVVCPVIPAIVALVLASSAKRKIDESGGRLTGEGLVTAARWIAIVHLALVGLFIAFIVVVGIIAAFSSPSTTTEFRLVGWY